MGYTAVGNTFRHSSCLSESAVNFKDIIPLILSSSMPNTVQSSCMNSIHIEVNYLVNSFVSSPCMSLDIVAPLTKKASNKTPKREQADNS